MADESHYSRRSFLVRAGVMSAALALLNVDELLRASPAAASSLAASGKSGSALLRLVDLAPLGLGDLAPIFDQLSTDTMNGLIAFVVPGPDAYSLSQGVSDTNPGGIDAGGPAFLLNALDNFFPVPQEPLQLLVQAVTTGLVTNLPGLPGLPIIPGLAEELDLALDLLLAQQTTIPLSLLIALLLNFVATLINPTSLAGEFVSPFSQLSFAEKTSVFATLEGEAAAVAAMIDQSLPQPLQDSISGLIEFVAGALLEFAGFGCYSEFGVFDPTTRTLTSTPVGWTISKYLALAPNTRPVEGWDELKGYLGGVSKASE
jgi:hypothetical protein